MVPHNKKTIRSNKAQINYLCQYMAQHPAFAAGDYNSPLGVAKLNAEWAELKQALDEFGPSRTIDQWKICWRDQKRKARDEVGALNKAKTTSKVAEMPELSRNSALVLSAIGQEMIVGCGPEESPIGFTQATTPLSTPGPSLSRSVHAAVTPGSSGMQTPAPRAVQRPLRRARQVLPPDRFLNAQLELNNLMKELITEVRRSNDLKEEHLNFLRRGRNDE